MVMVMVMMMVMARQDIVNRRFKHVAFYTFQNHHVFTLSPRFYVLFETCVFTFQDFHVFTFRAYIGAGKFLKHIKLLKRERRVTAFFFKRRFI